jgi:hypothetical protein
LNNEFQAHRCNTHNLCTSWHMLPPQHGLQLWSFELQIQLLVQFQQSHGYAKHKHDNNIDTGYLWALFFLWQMRQIFPDDGIPGHYRIYCLSKCSAGISYISITNPTVCYFQWNIIFPNSPAELSKNLLVEYFKI